MQFACCNKHLKQMFQRKRLVKRTHLARNTTFLESPNDKLPRSKVKYNNPSLWDGAQRYLGVSTSLLPGQPDQICDLPLVSRKPALTCFMVGLSATKQSPPPGFLVRGVYDMDTQQNKKQNLSKGRGASCEPKAIHM